MEIISTSKQEPTVMCPKITGHKWSAEPIQCFKNQTQKHSHKKQNESVAGCVNQLPGGPNGSTVRNQAEATSRLSDEQEALQEVAVEQEAGPGTPTVNS